MGLNTNGTRFMLYAKKLGVDFTQTAMIGRQGLHLNKSQLRKIFKQFGYSAGEEQLHAILNDNNRYAETLFQYLGAKQVHSFDNSDFENATYQHDMNTNIADIYKDKYSVVVDGGSLEHVFNFPVAIKNCMEMLKTGGHYLGITPGNNLLGHGFYQFSPELFFSIFTPANGFELLDVIAFEDNEDQPSFKWFRVKSPTQVKKRVTLTNKVPVSLLIIAKKINRAAIFDSTPQQSDYVIRWEQKNTQSLHNTVETSPGRTSRFTAIKNNIPLPIRKSIKPLLKTIRRLLGLSSKGFRSRFFQRFDPTDKV